jgi:glycolate oxidase iron-sulfur subunit
MTGAIQACVHCGFCLAACPTYQVLGEEMDSPRGRIYLMKQVLEENLSAGEAQSFLDRCLGCLACMPACPSGVGYGDLLIGYRALTEPTRQRSFPDNLARQMIAQTLPYPNRFRLAAAFGQIGRLFKGMMPPKIAAMLALLPQKLPKARPLPEIYPAQGERRARVALLAGCAQTVLAPEINWATLRVLAQNGVETIIPKGRAAAAQF